jgi:hypothetical protein
MKRQVTRIVLLLASAGMMVACTDETTREPNFPTPVIGETSALREHKEGTAPSPEPGREFSQDQRWELSDPVAVKALQNTAFGEQEIKEFWTRKGWRLTKHEERYMTQVDALVAEGKIKKSGHWAQTPFNGVYTAVADVTIDDKDIPARTEFWMEFCENEDEIHMGRPLFTRVVDYVEEHQGHSDQASDAHPGELRQGRERR